MSKLTKMVIVFVVICMASAFIGWLSGYNFDHRSEGVALWSCTTMLLGTVIGCMVGFEV